MRRHRKLSSEEKQCNNKNRREASCPGREVVMNFLANTVQQQRKYCSITCVMMSTYILVDFHDDTMLLTVPHGFFLWFNYHHPSSSPFLPYFFVCNDYHNW
ncbi:unnamed protein product [Heterosigma akashiwo]|mmetsp:Transcript_29849/g.51836  ORF Transcript_29849/g.51836 Transcript_29849/m.51836 type:complete len:101 (+) Transcript_29849:182-484(+)